MGTVKKINDEYYIEFAARGLTYQKKAGSDKQSAERLLKETERMIQHGESLTDFEPIKYARFFEEFMGCTEEDYPHRSRQRFKICIEGFSNYLSGNDDVNYLTQITPAVIEDYRYRFIKKGLNVQERSKEPWFNFSLLLLREVFDYGIRKGYVTDNPTLHIKPIKIDNTFSPRVLSEKARLSPRNQEILEKIKTCGSFAEFLKSFNNSETEVSFIILRNTFLRDAIVNRVSLAKVCRFSGFKDVLRLYCFSHFL